MTLLSAAIITLNEAERIEACLESLSFCDEIVLLDSGSRDRTVELARRFTGKIYIEAFKGDGPQKNSVVDKTSGQWVFLIDADEIVPPALAEEIQAVVAAGGRPTGHPQEPAAWSVPRKNHFGGVWVRHGGWYPDRQIRLWKRGRAVYENSEVHPGLIVDGPVARLKNPLLHYTYDSEADYLDRQEIYARRRAADYHRQGRPCGPLTGPVHAAANFLQAYIVRAGFLDGRLGLRLAWLRARFTRRKYAHLARLRREAASR